MRGRNTELSPLSRKETRVSVARGFGGPRRGATVRSVQAEPRATSGLLRDLLLRGGQSWAWMKDSPPHLAAPGHTWPRSTCSPPAGAGSGHLPSPCLDSRGAWPCGKDGGVPGFQNPRLADEAPLAPGACGPSGPPLPLCSVASLLPTPIPESPGSAPPCGFDFSLVNGEAGDRNGPAPSAHFLPPQAFVRGHSGWRGSTPSGSPAPFPVLRARTRREPRDDRHPEVDPEPVTGHLAGPCLSYPQ